MKEYRKRAIILLVITAILWSTGGLFIKLIDWNPMAIAGARSGIAAIVMLVYLRKPIRFYGKTSFAGSFAYASLLILFVSANKLTTSANAILLQFTAPVWVALFSGWFLKERVRKYDWVTITVVMLGMLLFFIGDIGGGNMFGNIVAVLSGIAMAGFVILLKLQKEGSTVEVTLTGNILTFIIGVPFFFLSAPNLRSILGLLALGVFQLGISYILYTTAIKYVSAVEAILIPIIEPLLNPLWVLLFTGESPGIYALWGGVVVITAIIARSVFQQGRNLQKLE